MMKNRITFVLLVAAGVSACDRPAFLEQAREAEARQPVHVDSVLPIEEDLRRFRSTLTEHADSLTDASPDAGDLVRRYVEALEAADTTALLALTLTAAEFAYLYYPHTRYTERPYELSPAVVWFQLDNRSGRGLSRALQRHGGRPLGFQGFQCDEEPTVEGPNRIWSRCVLDRIGDDGRVDRIALLGPVFERAGRFKFLSHANGL